LFEVGGGGGGVESTGVVFGHWGRKLPILHFFPPI
jgi:hypothetical protein